jgi:hypothetical protein
MILMYESWSKPDPSRFTLQSSHIVQNVTNAHVTKRACHNTNLLCLLELMALVQACRPDRVSRGSRGGHRRKHRRLSRVYISISRCQNKLTDRIHCECVSFPISEGCSPTLAKCATSHAKCPTSDCPSSELLEEAPAQGKEEARWGACWRRAGDGSGACALLSTKTQRPNKATVFSGLNQESV